MSETAFLEKVKALNIPRRNCVKTKEELEKAIKDTIIKYKEIAFGAYSPACMKYLNEPRKQQLINEKVHDQKLMDDIITKLAWDGLQKI